MGWRESSGEVWHLCCSVVGSFLTNQSPPVKINSNAFLPCLFNWLGVASVPSAIPSKTILSPNLAPAGGPTAYTRSSAALAISHCGLMSRQHENDAPYSLLRSG